MPMLGAVASQQKMLQVLLVLVLLVSLTLPVDGQCISSLDEITHREIETAQKPAEERSKPVTYVLCPNHVYRVGLPSEVSPIIYEGGSLPIVLLNSHRTVQCGLDGNPANNCTLHGGHHQLLVPSTDDLPKEFSSIGQHNAYNLTIRGIRFQAAEQMSLAMTNAGSLSIDGCIFDSQLSGEFVAYFKPPALSNENRKLAKFGPDTTDGGLSGDDTDFSFDPHIKVAIANTLWKANTVNIAVVAATGNVQIDIVANKFEKNNIRVQIGAGSVVWLTDGRGTLQDSCFSENSYPLSSTIVNGGVFEITNNAGRDLDRSQSTGCTNAWLYVQPSSTLGRALPENDFRCTPFEKRECPEAGSMVVSSARRVVGHRISVAAAVGAAVSMIAVLC